MRTGGYERCGFPLVKWVMRVMRELGLMIMKDEDMNGDEYEECGS